MDTIINQDDNHTDRMTLNTNNPNTMATAMDDEMVNQEVKSIEINLNVIKTFFLNTISLYEFLVKNLCTTCNVVESEEFVALHKNLLDFENIFKIFEVSFNKTLLTTLVKKNIIRDDQADGTSRDMIDETFGQNAVTSKYPCYVSSCSQFYSSEEGAKIHFIKNHCKRGMVMG